MNDSRLRRAQAAIDDARTSIADAQTILTELGDEFTNNNLEAARFSLNVAIRHLQILEAS